MLYDDEILTARAVKTLLSEFGRRAELCKVLIHSEIILDKEDRDTLKVSFRLFDEFDGCDHSHYN